MSIARVMMPVTSGRNNVTSTTTTIVQMAINLFMKAVPPTSTKSIMASERPHFLRTMTMMTTINRGDGGSLPSVIDIRQLLSGAVDRDLLIHKHFSSAPQDN